MDVKLPWVAQTVAEPLRARPPSPPAANDVSPVKTVPPAPPVFDALASETGASAASRSGLSVPPLLTKVLSIDVSSKSRATTVVELRVQSATNDSEPLEQTRRLADGKDWLITNWRVPSVRQRL